MNVEVKCHVNLSQGLLVVRNDAVCISLKFLFHLIKTFRLEMWDFKVILRCARKSFITGVNFGTPLAEM